MAFHFKLATLLKIRDELRKQEERALQITLLEIAQLRHTIDQVDDAIATARRGWQQRLRTSTVAAEVQAIFEFEQMLGLEKETLIAKLREVEAEQAEQRNRYQRAYQEHEAVLNMRRDQLAAYEQQRARTEQKQLDDTFAAHRRRRL